jgi:hypothetical protein
MIIILNKLIYYIQIIITYYYFYNFGIISKKLINIFNKIKNDF